MTDTTFRLASLLSAMLPFIALLAGYITSRSVGPGAPFLSVLEFVGGDW